MASAFSLPDPNWGPTDAPGHGIFSDRFRNNGNMDLKSLTDWTTESTFDTNPLITYNFPIAPLRDGLNRQWDTGTMLFMKRDTQMVKQMFDLSMLRAMFYMAKIQQVEGERTDPNGRSALSGARSRGDNYMYLADLGSVRENLAFIGTAYSGSEPSIGPRVGLPTDGMAYTGGFMMQNCVFQGMGTIPNFWGALAQNQKLYLIIKPMVMESTYYTAQGTPVKVPASILAKKRLVLDVCFYTSVNNAPPSCCTDASLLLKADGGQPPIDDAAWIDWRRDSDGNILYGTLERGIVIEIGSAYHSEVDSRQQPHAPGPRVAERLPWNMDYNTLYKPMEVRFNIKNKY